MRERPLHGGEDRSAAPVVLDFSVNTNPLGMPPAVRQLLREETSLAEQYPDRTAKALRESLAAKWKVPPEQILMGNGASEILMLAALALGFVVRPIAAAAEKGIVANIAGLHMWLVVFAVVALQTVTLVRPMLAPIGTPRTPSGKCFFLMHFGESIADEFRSSAR